MPEETNNLPGYNTGQRPTQGLIKTIDREFYQAHNVTELKNVLTGIASPNITQEHVDFIEKIGREWGNAHSKSMEISPEDPQWQELEDFFALRKLRQLYTEIIRFDLEHGTQTAGFISESYYQESAQDNIANFASSTLEDVKQGVKHRASLTSVIRSFFNKSTSILGECNVSPDKVSAYDIGCGAGKPSLIARLNYDFKNVVGIDYFMPVLQFAQKNREDMGMFGDEDRKIAFKFRNASKFADFRGPVIVVYCYNPFGEKIMQDVVENLEETDRPVIFGYNKPKHIELFKSDKGWNGEIITSSLDDDSNLAVLTRNLHKINNNHSPNF
ncbi:MAG: class I SAM-dependent methyltransferase [Alphaproteobacteria bacterium]